MSRVQATTDYLGPDCRYLNFKTGEEIIVYSKLSRKNENLWTGSKGKDFGYFPKDAVKVEEVFISEEVEVLTKETDFLCLHGDKYTFENEDSMLHDHNKESEYSSSDAESKLCENELLKHTRDSMQKEGVESVSEKQISDSQKSLTQEESASNKLVRKNENSEDDTEEPQMQNSLQLEPVSTQSSWIAGWFTTGSENDEEPLEPITESLENTYRGRKIVLSAEDDLQEPNDKEEQEPPASVWFQGGLTDFLYFGEENNVDVGLASEKNDPQIHDVSDVPRHSNNEQETAATEETAVTELPTEESESQESKSDWFNLGLSNVLNFGHSEEDQQRRETKDKTSKTEEVQTLDQKESHMDKETKEIVKEATEAEDEENYAQEIIDSNSNVPYLGEILAGMGTLHATKSPSNSTKTYFDILTGDEEKAVEPYSSGQDLVSESQLLKTTEAEKTNQESESKYGRSGVGSRRKLLEETPEKEHEISAAVENEHNSDQRSKATVIPSVNYEEKIDSSVVDSQFDVKKPFSDAIQNYVPRSEGGWVYQILLCLNALEIGELMKSALSAVMSIIKQ
ncbi:PREDICTED: melanoma inhibitory activity protein 2, partial [Merops nubicus]|uniref:melanoma inhibitory activity protein 2 n=1 Tax=Merops nubicus TaxID=57421 RepID=UPI0004F044E9